MENYWARTEKALLQMESDEKYDLFVIGYVIPHLGLSEVNCPEDADPENHFKGLVRASIEKDKGTMTVEDLATLEQILNEI